MNAARPRELINRLPGSKIREVANAALGRPDVLAFWFGESDEVTPAPVREEARRRADAPQPARQSCPAGAGSSNFRPY